MSRYRTVVLQRSNATLSTSASLDPTFPSMRLLFNMECRSYCSRASQRLHHTRLTKATTWTIQEHEHQAASLDPATITAIRLQVLPTWPAICFNKLVGLRHLFDLTASKSCNYASRAACQPRFAFLIDAVVTWNREHSGPTCGSLRCVPELSDQTTLDIHLALLLFEVYYQWLNN